MPYIYFTDEQKLRANSVDLERYLLQNGEELIRSGPEKRLKSDKSITIRGSEWFDHAQAVKTGGGPVAFVMYHYGLSYPEVSASWTMESAIFWAVSRVWFMKHHPERKNRNPRNLPCRQLESP